MTDRTNGVYPPTDWPEPAPPSRARGQELEERIRHEIHAEGGAISFERYMELALYTPRLGYYSADDPKFGEGGDYITAPELSPLFGRCLANQVAQILQTLGQSDVLEVGAGSGALAAEVLLALEALGHLPRRYFILELSATLRVHQRQILERRAVHLLPRVQWLDELPAPGFRGVVLGNELLDAMPVAKFRVVGEEVVEQYVGYKEQQFILCDSPASVGVHERVAPLALADGYCSEVGLQAQAWVRSVGERLAAGVMLLIDYGFPRAEFYHPQRRDGTLMCHYRHLAHADPLISVGLQDITAHVDFTSIAEAGRDVGLDLLGYTSQAAFLIGSGIIGLASEPLDDKAQLLRAQVINKLTGPHEMGELFKVIALGRGVDVPLSGFAMQDRRQRL